MCRLKQEIVLFAERSYWATNEHEILSIGTILNVETIYTATGFDLSGFHRNLDNFGVRHIFKKHGIESIEIKRGQRAVISSDFALIPEVVNNPDKIEYAGKSRFAKADLIKYQKRIGEETYFYVEEIRKKRRVVATETMWIRR
jgi:hypothetical protein